MTRLALLALLACAACGPGGDDASEASPEAPIGPAWSDRQEVADRVASIDGFAGPEAVRYDPDQDVWFVANFGPGDGEPRDADGFISRVSAATGTIDSLRFAVGTDAHPMHMPRGMYITGDTLWVADVDGVHAVHRVRGEHLGFVDLTGFEPGFVNDVAQGPDGALYATDTGRSAVYRIFPGAPEEVLGDPGIGSPNGITWDPARAVMILVPWEPQHPVHTWNPADGTVGAATAGTPGRMDGVEAVAGRLVMASQTDSALHVIDDDGARVLIRVDGRPADIGVDTRRNHVAVPYIALNRVDIWRLPAG